MESSDWRRNPWVWLVIGIPTATVIGCAITIYLAITNPEFIVKDDASPPAAAHGSIDHGER